MNFEEYLEKKKPELRKLKDSDFIPIEVDVPEPMVDMMDAIEMQKDILSKEYGVDRQDIDVATLQYGNDMITRIINNKGLEYTKELTEKLLKANKKGDMRAISKLVRQMTIDAGDE